MYRPFQHKVDYEGDTYEKDCNTYDLQSYNDNLVLNLGKEKQYKEDDECKEDYSMVSKTNEFQMSESKIEQTQLKQLLAKGFPIEVIRSVIITVNTCKQKMI